MAAGTLISVEEYLSRSYRPDCDYIDGEVRERNLGERDHSRTQRRILSFLEREYPHLTEFLFPEQRVQVSLRRFRIPDVCVLAENAPEESIVHTAPALCIEILSRDDRMPEIMERIEDYFAMGVPVCWIIDPIARQAWTAIPGKLTKSMDGILRAGAIGMPLASIFTPQA